ncbi:MAG: Formation of crista junctions protein 1 [Pycnora praestabilis]|nr:MAG: Formation of crista junctions protein 1 [Pycnora praestabilis]
MLRTFLLSSRRLTYAPIACISSSQWLAVRRGNAQLPQQLGRRNLVDTRKSEEPLKESIKDSDTIVLPGSRTTASEDPIPLPPGQVDSVSPESFSPGTPSSDTTIPPQNVPLMPPAPPAAKIQTSPPISIPPSTTKGGNVTPPTIPLSGSSDSASPPPPPPPRRNTHRFRTFLIALTLLSGVGFAGGVYYSLISDNFHDFFTEYVPFGESAVLYFEERDFRRRFPNAANTANNAVNATQDLDNKITIPSKSGLSWRVAEEERKDNNELHQRGRPVSALDETKDLATQQPGAVSGLEQSKAVKSVKSDALSPSASPAKIVQDSSKQPKKGESSVLVIKDEGAKRPRTKTEHSNKGSNNEGTPRIVALDTIDPLKIGNANEPVVQDLVKLVNDIITVINADNSSERFSSSINKAKSELGAIGGKIMALKDIERQAAKDQIKSSNEDFDKAAKDLVRRFEDEMREQEARWKDEFEAERENISQSYRDKLKTELERSRQISEQRLRNELLEQAIEMKRKFIGDVRNRVELERNGRLGKLSELSSSVSELEKLTTDWNSVIDSNLKTQHLHVTVEAVRANLEMAEHPRPFIRELAALKEVASDDPVVNAAIASINPTAYQRGVPSSADLIDRFRRVAWEVRKASLLPENAGVASHAASLLLSKVMFKKRGLAIGDDVESVLTRTETLLEEGNLDDAAREMNGLHGWAKTLSKDWLGEARRVLEVQQALDVISTEARLQSLRLD